jgi:hypothetical protein
MCDAAAANAAGPMQVLLASNPEVASIGDVLVGNGIPLPGGISSRPAVGALGELVWRPYRNDQDRIGMRHVFYRQYLVPSMQLAASVPAEYQTEGIPLPDTALGLHYEANGTLAFVYGHQAAPLNVINYPWITSPQAAAYNAVAAVVKSGSYEPFDPSTLDPERLAAWETSAELSLRWDERAGGYRFAWSVVVPSLQRESRIPIVDAQTGDLLTFHEVGASATPCSTDTTTALWGTAYPQWGSYGNPRSVSATLDQGGLTFEAHWPRQVPYNPPIEVYWYDHTMVDYPHPPWPCYFGRQYAFPFELIQIPKQADNTPNWGGWASAPIEREAADVLYSSRKAMEASYAFGWNGYKGLADVGLNDPARVLIDKFWSERANGGHFYYVDTDIPDWYSNVLADMVAIGKQTDGALPNVTACGDLVAHEWGHGITKYSASIPDYPGLGTEGQLLEGFSDVFGHIVEHYAPSVTGVVDWTLFKDCLGPRNQRRADAWQTWPPYYALAELCYYKGQTVYDDSFLTFVCPSSLDGRYAENHQAGHMLGVALYLLGDGARTDHRNPAYGIPGQSNAPSQVVSSLGVTKASAIFFRAMTYYLTSTTTWEGVPALAVRSAYELYRNCPSSNAQAEQDATAAAFTAIGYPYASRWTCP